MGFRAYALRLAFGCRLCAWHRSADENAATGLPLGWITGPGRGKSRRWRSLASVLLRPVARVRARDIERIAHACEVTVGDLKAFRELAQWFGPDSGIEFLARGHGGIP